MILACSAYCTVDPASSRGTKCSPTNIFFRANRPNSLQPGDGRRKQKTHASDRFVSHFNSARLRCLRPTPTIYPLANFPSSKSAVSHGKLGWLGTFPLTISSIAWVRKILLGCALLTHGKLHSTSPASVNRAGDKPVVLEVNKFLDPLSDHAACLRAVSDHLRVRANYD